ncbi:MAG TPA: YbhB/YbcL family Raf kinase inhibitor-like protein [Chlamydiales bacterium]|nr:YbhB/YbcL family Raf kinase inhibitor-like protein [Chlamydiales bacterium]
MRLTSPVFAEGGVIPSVYTCEGKNISPPLEFFDVPHDATSLVLIMDDPDVPAFVRPEKMYDHWIVFNMPPTTKQIRENHTPPGLCGKNTEGKNAYIGPCPPDAEHRYFFKLYALDKMLDLHAGATKSHVEGAMKGHIIDECSLMGRYEKGKG